MRLAKALFAILASAAFFAGANPNVAPKYEQVSKVMRSVFGSGGDVSPASPAVKHAADVDMPARGGTPEKLKEYLSKPEVKKWYREKFNLK